MSMNPEQLDKARDIVSDAADLRSAAAALRQQFAGLRALVLDPMDMRDETPALQVGQRSMYLMSTDGHCWSVTQNLAQASGIVLTQA